MADKSEIHGSSIERKYKYREICYTVVFPTEDSTSSFKYFCAYFILNTKKVNLKLNVGLYAENGFFGSSGFLGSSVISKIQEEAHGGFTFAEINKVTTKENDLITREYVKLGVDYNHLNDSSAGHTLESVCRDCEVVIDRIHEIGAYQGET